ncbi:class I SAM-dependent methyltransferase [Gimesia algae]|uniref:Demethylrebeccamycin-D-glucose O-methyltransferase n=1 Tax=Gimesia algae TaxID=2527971 RepID=A0A517VMU2_9PLAN|nr:class I SAM-dependent methyltransferase [Gimesia algae]QDT94348.1 Demethylrebeccamycin-D-glucose O-methyltransferase [Gimesia algae]
MPEIRNIGHYDRKYATSDFDYSPERERGWLQEHLIDRFDLKPGDRVLDLGCGKGLHASLLSSFGLNVFGVELSAEGVRGANARGSTAVFINASASDLPYHFDTGYFDLIYCRGMSWFHRELHEVCPSTGVNVSEHVPKIMEFIRPGGLFVLQICTDFTGRCADDGVIYNRLSDYIDLFSPHGEIVHLTNWAGVGLLDDEQAAEVKGGIVIATQK